VIAGGEMLPITTGRREEIREPKGSDRSNEMILRAQVLLSSGQIRKAQELLEQICKLQANNAEAHFLLGVALYNQKSYSTSVLHFEAVTHLAPSNVAAFDYLGLNYEYLGQISKAELAYKKGLQLNQKSRSDDFLDYNYARFLMRQNRLSEAKAHMDSALKYLPNKRPAYYESGKLGLQLHDYKQARIDLEKALTFDDPSGAVLDLQVYYLLSLVCNRLGDDQMARKYVELTKTSPAPKYEPLQKLIPPSP
jgi:tetratricopeptide (TPR) repeat protein